VVELPRRYTAPDKVQTFGEGDRGRRYGSITNGEVSTEEKRN